jgi:hypothetical protein
MDSDSESRLCTRASSFTKYIIFNYTALVSTSYIHTSTASLYEQGEYNIIRNITYSPWYETVAASVASRMVHMYHTNQQYTVVPTDTCIHSMLVSI